jgi:hypothetical protein
MHRDNLIALKSAGDSSRRSRRIVLLIQLACIVVFMMFWQQRLSGWPMMRLRAASAAALVASCDAKSPDEASQCRDRLPQPTLSQGRTALQQWPFSQPEAEYWVSLLQATIANHVINAGIPVLGLSVDVNDLGLLGGITFLTLLVWFRFSLWREQANLHYLFERCSDNISELQTVYELLSMTQVLSVPRMLSDKHKRQRPLALMPVVLLASPVVVEMIVLIHDVQTFDRGGRIAALVTNMEFSAGLMILVVMIWLSWECLKFYRFVRKEWDDTYDKLQEASGVIHTRSGERMHP